jgi:putative transposase
MARRYGVSDADWVRIEPLLKGQEGDVGRSGGENRWFINAVVWIAHSGAAWRDLPQGYGNWNSVYQRFRRWAKSGHWQKILQALQDPDLDGAMLDSSQVRGHQQAAGQKKARHTRKPRGIDHRASTH